MSALQEILTHFRNNYQSEREKGTYFEELMVLYFRNEPLYRDLYSNIWRYADWANERGISAQDDGIDLVAKTLGTNEYHAIQCKFYAEDYNLQKSNIDSFFTASGKAPFTHRIIISTTNNWSKLAEDALIGQQIAVTRITLNDLEKSQIDWKQYEPGKQISLKDKKILRPHQTEAVEAIKQGLSVADRGKLIMACGTGKTFTSLKIAEDIAGLGGRVLFLVPSLSLLSQTLTEWTHESAIPLHSFAVCSDHHVGKKSEKIDDKVELYQHELRYPATTNAKKLSNEMAKRYDKQHMTVVFSTYHSIDVVSEAQLSYGLQDFDLIICDEAHRTTGAKFEDDYESHFTKVHNQAFIKAIKRLYMTATPRIYGNSVKVKAEQDSIELCSMDDESLYGKELHTISFSEAVAAGLLVDYKVIVLALEADHVSERIQDLIKDENNQINIDDATKIIGCWKALSKQRLSEHDRDAMKRAVAFCQIIEPFYKSKKHKVSSKKIANIFQQVVENYQANAKDEDNISVSLKCEVDHVDGGMNASKKEEKLNWLKSEIDDNTCRILSNVRCLSEGVDVPALDAILFLAPRDSQVDVVQSVGRVMRKAEGKTLGYVILPVVIPAGMEAHDALNDNEVYRAVWQVLQALRSHDDCFDAMINKTDLIGPDKNKIEIVIVSDKLPAAKKKRENLSGTAYSSSSIGKKQNYAITTHELDDNQFEQITIGDTERAIYAKIVQKCGRRTYWEEWVQDIAKIAETHKENIISILRNEKNEQARQAFDSFVKELHDDINDSLSNDEVIEMLAQHLITKPVFEALFAGYNFAQYNPISKAMQDVLQILQEDDFTKNDKSLQQFYNSVRMRAKNINTSSGRQKIVLELYDKFFSKAFPKMKDRLGIVYTPVEVVDFIIYSVNDVLKNEFGETLGSPNIHIIDPFTGTGTFITRLLQSGLITPDQLAKKYKTHIHANEIVLLAYYIAAINIESTYHDIMNASEYVPFEGICLTDTFQMYEKDDRIDIILEDNSKRRKRQKKLDIRVIIGNPPYSVGQKSENDNNSNIEYPFLDKRVRETYAANSNAQLAKGLYDNYIRAIRWASDRIGDCGVIGFVTNASFIHSNTTDGLRKCLVDEFSNIYIFNLRGDQRTSGELSRKEGGKIFGSGSRAPIAISILVKNPNSKSKGQVFYYDIGDYLSRDEKLDIINHLASIDSIESEIGWQNLLIDNHGDWLNQQDDTLSEYMLMGDKKRNKLKLFQNYSLGIATNRDAWCYNFSKNELNKNIQNTISFYNGELARFNNAYPNSIKKQREGYVESFINTDPTKISWTHNLKQSLIFNKSYKPNQSCIIKSLYRPFTKEWLYFSRDFNERVYQMPQIFPDDSIENIAICITGIGGKKEFSTMMVNSITSLDTIEKGQCFPLYLYEKTVIDKNTNLSIEDFTSEQADLKNSNKGYTKKDAITEEGLIYFLKAYPNENITKEDIFYYIYGILHSEEYRAKFKNNLAKELPYIPCVKNASDFWAYSDAGRELADLHINYESVPLYPAKVTGGEKPEDFIVEQMRYAKKDGKEDKTRLMYNQKIEISEIPLEAYDYVVNGKPALSWIVERYCNKTDKKSQIKNDANHWAIESTDDYKYTVELFLRVITVSVETMKIVKNLPKLDIK